MLMAGDRARADQASATPLAVALETYLTNRMDDARNGIGRANPRSVKIYRSGAENWIKPILGELQVRHLKPARLATDEAVIESVRF